MTKKDFVAIAKAFDVIPSAQTVYPSIETARDGYRVGVLKVAYALADQLAAANPRFDRRVFLTACGFKDAL